MTATGSHLFGGRINLMLVRESARIELKEILGNPTQKKVSLFPVIIANRVQLHYLLYMYNELHYVLVIVTF